MEANNTVELTSCNEWSKYLSSLDHKVLYAAILLTFSPIVILLNLILIFSFIATQQVTQNISNLLIFILRFSDLTVGSVSMPLKASIMLNLTSKDLCIRIKLLVLFNTFEYFSAMLTVLLAVDRYLHMNPCIQSRPSKLRKLMEKPKIYYFVFVLLIFHVSLFALTIVYGSLEAIIKALFLSLISVQLIITSCLYARGYLRIRKFTDSNPVYCDNDGSSASTPDYVRKLYKTVMILVALAVFQYVPYFITWISGIFIGLFTKIDIHAYSTVGEYLILLTYAGYCTNCIAVLHFNKQARDWIFKVLRLKQTTAQNA